MFGLDVGVVARDARNVHEAIASVDIDGFRVFRELVFIIYIFHFADKFTK